MNRFNLSNEGRRFTTTIGQRELVTHFTQCQVYKPSFSTSVDSVVQKLGLFTNSISVVR